MRSEWRPGRETRDGGGGGRERANASTAFTTDVACKPLSSPARPSTMMVSIHTLPSQGLNLTARARGGPSPFGKRGTLSTCPRTSCRAWRRGTRTRTGPGRRFTGYKGLGIGCPEPVPVIKESAALLAPHGEWLLCQPRAKEMDDVSARRDCAVPGRAISLCLHHLRPFTLCKHHRDNLCGGESAGQFTFKYLTWNLLQ